MAFEGNFQSISAQELSRTEGLVFCVEGIPYENKFWNIIWGGWGSTLMNRLGIEPVEYFLRAEEKDRRIEAYFNGEVVTEQIRDFANEYILSGGNIPSLTKKKTL